MIAPESIAEILGLGTSIRTVGELESAVSAGLPKHSLELLSARLYDDRKIASAYKFQVVPQATWKRRIKWLSVDESERTERLARVLAHAEYVWDDREQARGWMSKSHRELQNSSPLEVARTELGARRVEDLLDKLFYGLPVQPVIAYRIADARHPIFDPTGAMLHGGRWNSIGRQVIYAGESYAGAMLEVLVHANLSAPPKNHRVVRITIPDKVKIESMQPAALANWDSESLVVSREFGDTWIKERRTAVLRVPSVITEGRENNFLINPLHPQFSLIVPSEPELIRWDVRLFQAQGK